MKFPSHKELLKRYYVDVLENENLDNIDQYFHESNLRKMKTVFQSIFRDVKIKIDILHLIEEGDLISAFNQRHDTFKREWKSDKISALVLPGGFKVSYNIGLIYKFREGKILEVDQLVSNLSKEVLSLGVLDVARDPNVAIQEYISHLGELGYKI
jgi:hypothetical protein